MDGPVVAGFAMLGNTVVTILGNIIGSIAHISPKFDFDEFVLSNFFGSLQDLWWNIVKHYTKQALLQSYKVISRLLS